MDELVKLVSQKTGLSEEMSKVAVVTVLDYLKKETGLPTRLVMGRTTLQRSPAHEVR